MTWQVMPPMHQRPFAHAPLSPLADAALGAGAAQANNAPLLWSIVIGSPGHARTAYLRPTHWDRDGDGIPNRHDRHPDRAQPGR